MSRTDKANILREHYSKLGKLGSKARAESLTAKRRSEIAAMGGKARKKKIDQAKESA